MWAAIVSAIGGAVIGGAVRGVVASETNKKKIEAYQNAAKQVKEAADKYSGEAGFQRMIDRANMYASEDAQSMGNEMAAATYAPTNPGAVEGKNAAAYNAAGEAGNAVNSTAMNSYNQGMVDANAENQAKYNANTVEAQQAMKQADIDTSATRQASQEIMNTVANAANTYGQLRTTKNGREVV